MSDVEREIAVNYRFFNGSDKDLTVTVAFPMPDIAWDGPDTNIAVPDPEAVNFLDFKTTDGPWEAVPITWRVTRLFLGVRVQCAQCHDHPFNPEWKQVDFWGVNAFFRTTTVDAAPTPPNAENGAQVTLSEDR